MLHTRFFQDITKTNVRLVTNENRMCKCFRMGELINIALHNDHDGHLKSFVEIPSSANENIVWCY